MEGMPNLIKRIKRHLYNFFIGEKIIKFGHPIDILDGNRVWLISDMHFNHRNILKWSRPEFRNVQEMNRRLISNWNHHVGKNDRVFCLGDFGDQRFMRKLNGKITLAKGNHDHRQWNRQFVVKYKDMKFLFIHDPDYQMTNWFDGDWIIHGHTHNNTPFIDIGRKRVNVSVEVINFTPITMEHLYQLLKESPNYRENRPLL
ncbi:MAG: hypothetical protein CVV32_12690 [Methanomicrobiales archaeon HGW-Methanomicrobiales-3]|nr:MAG: hypothetical protein CVV32_12690 [Methanomicrobiales archaeon HGW-Methanomicrobiales-3]